MFRFVVAISALLVLAAAKPHGHDHRNFQMPSNEACANILKTFHNPQSTVDEKKSAYDAFVAEMGNNWQAFIDGLKKLSESAVANQPALNGAEEFQKFIDSIADGSIVNVTAEQAKAQMEQMKEDAQSGDKEAWKAWGEAHKADFEALIALLPKGCLPEHGSHTTGAQ